MNPRNRTKKGRSPAQATSPLSPGRIWTFRALLCLFPFTLLGVLEIALRLGGYGFDPHFFKRMQIGHEDYFVQNDAFSYRFFPPAAARNPEAFRMKCVKPAGAIRIFVFGESAAMGDPEPAYGPARYLQAQLQAHFPETKFEIINTAFTAINSHVIVPISRECARHDADIWIIYMGNNEMVGPFGAATVFGRRAPPWPYVRLVTDVQQTHIGQLLAALSQKLHGGASKLTTWGGMEMFMNNQVPPDSPLKLTVYRNFDRNLDDILRAGTAAGAKVLLNTVAVNLRDCPPFASMDAVALSRSDAAQVQTWSAQATQLRANGDFVGAEKFYSRALRLDPSAADLQFALGQCFLADKQYAAAREHLQLACDDDALPFRADSRINSDIRAAAARFSNSGVVFFDAADALASQNPDDLCGDETFYEHVHFDFQGSYRLGLAWARQVDAMLPVQLMRSGKGWLSEKKCDDAVGLSDWNRMAVLEHMLQRMESPPLNGQSNNTGRMDRLQTRLNQLRAQMNPAAAASAGTNFLKQIASQPDDFLLRENYALFLQATGDLPGSITEWKQVHELIPQDYFPLFQAGRLLGAQHQWTEGEADLRAAVKIHPSLTDGWIELGNILAAQGDYSQSLRWYQTALAQRPSDASIFVQIGNVDVAENDHTAAVEHFRRAIQLNPNNWEGHYELGGELDAAGQLNQALAEFGKAVQLNPGFSRAHFNYGVLLAKVGRLDDAQREFQETLRLEPGYQNARDNLAKIAFLKQQNRN
ncbi:MAG TPA: tetratricopeptide repeat protein [Verrucomicrobiae bacterium]|nr:tetratricopeptide repeat protein [Verrucomicrobiae bacterium]